MKRFDVAPDGRLFRNQAGNYVDAAAYGVTRARAREHALTRSERASRLAERPYDLRHAGISFWLCSGVDPAECARRAGRSTEVLFRHYAKFLDGLREQGNRLIEQSMNEWQRAGQGEAAEDRTGIWSVTGPETLVRRGAAVGGTGSWRVIRARSKAVWVTGA